MKQFFRVKYQWQSVYHHHQKWCNDGSWERVWKGVLNKYKYLLDMSSIQMDGTHMPDKQGQTGCIREGRSQKPAIC